MIYFGSILYKGAYPSCLPVNNGLQAVRIWTNSLRL